MELNCLEHTFYLEAASFSGEKIHNEKSSFETLNLLCSVINVIYFFYYDSDLHMVRWLNLGCNINITLVFKIAA